MAEHWTSYSALTTHRECPQAWVYGHLRKLTKDDPEDHRVELEMGNWWHALRAADSIERGRALDSIRWVPETLKGADDSVALSTDSTRALTEMVFEEAQRWWDAQSTDHREVFVERIGWELPRGLEVTDEEYRKQWAKERETEAPLAVELEWKRRLPALPDGTDPATMLIGYVDEVFFDTRLNLVVVRDHKAHKVLSNYNGQSTVDDMMDSQLQIYAWGAAPTVDEWGRGPIRAVAYDRVRMSASKSPQVTQSGTLSKSVSDYDLRTYLEWCATRPEYPGRLKDGSGAGVYEAEESVVARLMSPTWKASWFRRTLTPLNVNLVRAHLRGAVDSGIDLQHTAERAAMSAMQVGRNLSSSCRWCPFAELCRAEMIGGHIPDEDLELSMYRLAKKPSRGR